MDLKLSKLLESIKRTYRWKSPIQRTKNEDFSIALGLVAFVFFVLRFFWFVQPIKVLVRWRKGTTADIPPLVIEAYIFASVGIEVVLCIALGHGVASFVRGSHLLCWVLMAKLVETLTCNIYYLLLRPVLEVKAPHSTYRSFVLASFGLVEVWLLLSLIWYGVGSTCPELDTIITSMYFTSVTFFTVGYGDYVPTGDFSHKLAILSIFASVGMVGIVLSRAIALIQPLPSSDGTKQGSN